MFKECVGSVCVCVWVEGTEKGWMLIPGFKIFHQEKQSISSEH